MERLIDIVSVMAGIAIFSALVGALTKQSLLVWGSFWLIVASIVIFLVLALLELRQRYAEQVGQNREQGNRF